MKRVCMVVPNRMVKGGIAAVVNGYRGSQLEKDYEITYVESYKDGSKFDKLLKGICGYFHFAYVLMFHKPDLVHIHSSFGPSFYRKMPFIYMASWRKIPIVNLGLFFFRCVYIELVKISTMYVINNRNFTPGCHINKWHLSIK